MFAVLDGRAGGGLAGSTARQNEHIGYHWWCSILNTRKSYPQPVVYFEHPDWGPIEPEFGSAVIVPAEPFTPFDRLGFL